ncbi:hypothetical protein SISNIDRAFT_465774 [Sistotremastrum niveocremeum HHB9708]|uniref:Uncharacterized protein n=1 Tax=Sistotremastrum niveocremeum HHB9708 TaxID=1314777 RepID=A0A164VME5_9AGAM|nr:hypothetical protein SISNIDRAFT_465774 [Sistotremastrum niveocremeum HHB9708]
MKTSRNAVSNEVYPDVNVFKVGVMLLSPISVRGGLKIKGSLFSMDARLLPDRRDVQLYFDMETPPSSASLRRSLVTSLPLHHFLGSIGVDSGLALEMPKPCKTAVAYVFWSKIKIPKNEYRKGFGDLDLKPVVRCQGRGSYCEIANAHCNNDDTLSSPADMDAPITFASSETSFVFLQTPYPSTSEEVCRSFNLVVFVKNSMEADDLRRARKELLFLKETAKSNKAKAKRQERLDWIREEPKRSPSKSCTKLDAWTCSCPTYCMSRFMICNTSSAPPTRSSTLTSTAKDVRDVADGSTFGSEPKKYEVDGDNKTHFSYPFRNRVASVVFFTSAVLTRVKGVNLRMKRRVEEVLEPIQCRYCSW